MSKKRALFIGVALTILTLVLTANSAARSVDINSEYISPNGVYSRQINQIPPEPPKPNIKPPQAIVVRTTASVVSTDCAEYRHIVEKYPDWNVDTMMYAMRLESNCNPKAVGDQYPINGTYAPSCGLLQIRTLKGRPDCETLKDAATNIEWAYRIWLSQGYGAWSVLH